MEQVQGQGGRQVAPSCWMSASPLGASPEERHTRAELRSCEQRRPCGLLRQLQEVPRGFEPRSLDSESRVLTVTPRDQMMQARHMAHHRAAVPHTCQEHKKAGGPVDRAAHGGTHNS